MEIRRRNTHNYSFKDPDLKKLGELASLITNTEDVRKLLRRLIYILSTKVKDELLYTLVQFYDPFYRCFTLHDYQVLATLEQYVYFVGVPVYDNMPSSGLKDIPKPQVLVGSIHLKLESFFHL